MVSQTPASEPDGNADGSFALQTRATPPIELLRTARRTAMRELAQARSCDCCDSLLHHLHQRIGSTLFFDDDPTRLWISFDVKDRERITVRVLAAYIALHGRDREDVFPCSKPRSWPALELLARAAPSARGADPAATDEMLKSIRQIISSAQQRAISPSDRRYRQAMAHLWAAADILEGLTK